MIAKFVIFGMLGICTNLFITALFSTIAKRKLELTGEASVVMFPVYGLVAFIYPVVAIHLSHLDWYLRGAAYMLIFYVFQYVIGLGLTKLRLCPWNYSGSFSLHGLIRLADAPIWFGCGLALEWIYPIAKAAANVI
ncbi:MAG TPA: hypothetical protein PKU96_06445 [bacterium]|jgi:hypothetical protein|nr:hypothetical protein [Myxococcales bacterium]OQA62138.1 MAG: hypothetical protein BWY40_00177 [bacterium ADurb.Bin270]HPW45991.1 hypothetical protein [bacterium]HQC51469.1 hypothetical protein [bacterium]HQG13819.1 hypothetical protein [bacterium]